MIVNKAAIVGLDVINGTLIGNFFIIIIFLTYRRH